MTRAEILSEIKLAEEEAKRVVIKSNEAKIQKISEAKAQSKEIIKKAEEEAALYSASEINKSREKFKKDREMIVEKGIREAEDAKIRARRNIPKAAEIILAEFERAANA